MSDGITDARRNSEIEHNKTEINARFTINPEYEFRNELSCIQDEFYRKLAISALLKAPYYFWFVPASSSGKYHPKSSLGMGGLVRHVKSVFAISEELLMHPLYAPFNNQEKDEIRVAILLHDVCKQGVKDEPSHTLTEHPLLVRSSVYPFSAMNHSNESRVTDGWEKWDRICNLIETHMGIWTKDKENNEVLKVPETKAQLFVHMCDFLASRKIIDVDITAREPQSSDYGKKEEPAWRKELATEGQISYVRKLMIMCLERNVASPVESIKLTDEQGNQIYTKGEASEHISSLKSVLGLP